MRALVLLAALLAGCAAPVVAPVEDASGAGSATLAFEGCVQTHTFATYPIEAFDGMLPEGWTVQPADAAGRTTQFYLTGSRCATAVASVNGASATIEELKEVWGYLFVVPPNGTDDAYDGELWPLGGFVSHGDALRVYTAWGLGDVVVQGETEILIDARAPGAVTSRTWASGEGETFEVDGGARGEPGPFHDGAFRVWIPAEGGAAGAFVYAWPEGATDLGLGPGTMRYGGPLLNATPATAVLVHHVEGVGGNATRLP